MRYSIAALALAGAVAALPSNIARDTVVNDVQVVQEVQWVTDVVTVTGAPAPAAATPAPAPPAVASPAPAPAVPQVQHNNHQQAAPSAPPATTFVQVVTQAPAAPASTPAPAPAASPAASSSSSSDPNSPDAILAVCNKWRTAYGLKTLTWDTELQGNAQKTGDDDQGTNENHELNGNSMAQVITPGINDCSQHNCAGLSTPFELAYLAGWLCEIPGKSALAGKCGTYTSAGALDLSSGETGHADILSNPDYTKIGCGFAKNGQSQSAQWTGLWICDLA